MRVKKTPPAVTPIYTTPGPNSKIDLYEGELEIEQAGVTYEFSGKIQMELTRLPTLAFEADRIAKAGEVALELDYATMRFPNLRGSAEVAILHSSQRTRAGGIAHYQIGRVYGSMRMGSRRRVSHVVGHVANFYDAYGSPISQGAAGWAGRIVLTDSDWRITIDSVEERILYDELKRIGGFAITHAVKIERVDGKEFFEEKIERLIEDLNLFLTFARGIWTCVFLFVGIDKTGTKAWEIWRAPKVDRFQIVDGWFKGLRGDILEGFWPQFREALRGETWGAVLRRALVWYVAANKREGDAQGAIVLAQAAHELISWTRFVTERRLSQKGFEDLPAADQIRLMLSHAGVSLAVPTHFSELMKNVAKKGEQIDGPDAISRIRNAIVHPKPQKQVYLEPDAVEQAWLLSMWYLDLTMLYLFGHHGSYANRTRHTRWHGESERVPWDS